MALGKPSFLSRVLFKRSIRRWARVADAAKNTPVSVLRKQRAHARRLLVHLNRFVHVADNRLALPLIGSQAIQTSHDSDWAWRPEAWSGPLPEQGMASVPSKSILGGKFRYTTIAISRNYHCANSAIHARQIWPPTACVWMFSILMDRSCLW